MSETLGLIAGRGGYPREVARVARARGLRVAAVAFHSETDPRIESEVDALAWQHLGELDRLIANLAGFGVEQAVMAGKVAKTHLFGDLRALRPDARALRVLARLADRRDDSILGAVVDEIAASGIRFPSQRDLLADIFAPVGRVGAAKLDAARWSDVAFGWPLAKSVAGLDVGQTLVVKERAVVAVEAVEGTDAAIARGGERGGSGTVVVKVAKPRQDPRFDLPTIGVDTIRALAGARASVFAFEAGQTVWLDRDALVAEADRAEIALVGIGADGPGEAPPS